MTAHRGAPPPRAPSAAGAARAAAPLLALLLLAAGAAAQSCTYSGVPAEKQNFGLALAKAGPDAVRTVSVGRGSRAKTVTMRTYCFALTNNAKRGAAAAPCDPADECCRPQAAKLASINIAARPECTSNPKAKAILNAATWKIGSRKLSRSVGAGTLKVSMPAPWSADAATMCVEIADDGSTAGDCATLESICGGASCKVAFNTAKFKSAAKGPSVSCCTKSSAIPLSCAQGMGAVDAGYSPCSACPANAFASVSAAGGTGLPICQTCPAGQVPDASQGGCVDACSPGTGGNPCTLCARGYFSAGGTGANPTAACTPCRQGMTTARVGARSQAECTVPVCAPGTGGVGCASCQYNYYSAGGTRDEPFKLCSACPTGSFTASMATRSAADCSTPAPPVCDKGYISGDDGACHVCPPNTYSEGGLNKVCHACPDGTSTVGFGSGSIASCAIAKGENDMSGAWAWTSNAGALYTEQCRADLAAFFDADPFDRRRGAVLRYDAGSCRATEAGFAEMQAFWAARILDKATAKLFKLGTPGAVALDWWEIGAASYDAVLGSGPKALLPAWTRIEDLEALFTQQGGNYRLGALYTKLANATVDTQSAALSAINAALLQRQDDAFTRFSGQMNAEGAHMWMLLRKLKGALELLIPGLRPEGERPAPGTITMVNLLRPDQLARRRKLLQSTIYPLRGMGLIQVDVNDKRGVYRNLVCGTGLFEDTLERASQMAINGWEYGPICKNWPGTEGAEDSEVTFKKFTDDKSVAESLAADIEVQASFSGVTLSGGAKYASEKLAKTNAVTIMQKASRLRAPPLALPDVVPNLTDTAVRILSTQGEARFRDIYGTHFVVGWRLGGYLLFSFSFYSNEQVSTLDISGQLSVEVAGSGSGKASAAFSNSDKFSTVNIESKIKTNTRLPVTNCAGLGVTTEIPDNAAIKQCVLDWLEAEGGASAAYYAYAVPYIYHPTYAKVLEDLYGGNATSAGAGAGRRLLREVGEIAGGRRALLQDAGAVVIDYKFKETGTLQSRINSIGNMLDTYKFKDDQLYFDAMSTLEGAQAIVTRILDGLRTKNITNIQQWQPLYNSALGLVNLASDQARITPFGARCGWCTKVTKDSRQGRCTSACDSTRNCTVTCPVPYATNSFGELPYDNPIGPYKANVSFVNETTDCSYRGFTYSTFVTKDGVSVPTCQTAVTGPVCSVFGSAESDNTGSYYCYKLPCDWRNEYCDGDVERDEKGVWACLGSCQPRSATNGSACLCAAKGNDTASGLYPPDASNDDFCFFGERLDRYMFTGGNQTGGGSSGNFWESRAKFQDAMGGLDISLYSKSPWHPNYLAANNGYDLAKSAFLTTNCPVVDDQIWLGGGRAAGRRLLAGDGWTDDGYDEWLINSCACSKKLDQWVGNYMAASA